MLEKPNLPDEAIIAHLRSAFGLRIASVEFLPLGADVNTAVYRAITDDGSPHFLKLRSGLFEPMSILVPRFLRDQGIRQIIAPYPTSDGHLWSRLEAYTCVLYPFVEGASGFQQKLSDGQWVEFGSSLKAIHGLALPPELLAGIPTEIYTDQWREMVKGFQQQVEEITFDDPVAERMAAFMRLHREEISHVVTRAEQLAAQMQSQPFELVLCHADIHGGNLLLTNEGAFYIVDWDNPILAPKERDLMFIGNGIGFGWNSAREVDLFYQGYGGSVVNLTALTYYRFERIVQDFAAYGEEILQRRDGGEDREQGLRYFTSQFEPGDVIEIAHQTDQRLQVG